MKQIMQMKTAELGPRRGLREDGQSRRGRGGGGGGVMGAIPFLAFRHFHVFQIKRLSMRVYRLFMRCLTSRVMFATLTCKQTTKPSMHVPYVIQLIRVEFTLLLSCYYQGHMKPGRPGY